MKLHQLAEQTGVKTIQLIEIAKALGLNDFHGGMALTAEQQTQIADTHRYMLTLKITDPIAAIAQINTAAAANAEDSIAISIQSSVADELCRRYPVGTMSDRILKTLGALSALENLLAPYPYSFVAHRSEDFTAPSGERQKLSTHH